MHRRLFEEPRYYYCWHSRARHRFPRLEGQSYLHLESCFLGPLPLPKSP